MHILLKSLMGSLLLCSLAWAEPSPPNTTTAQTTTATTADAGQPASRPGIIPAVAGTGPRVQAPQDKPLTAEQINREKTSQDAKVKAQLKDQGIRLQQLERANLEALSQNQELQLKNDNLGVQLQVLQSETSAQMFLYGAATIAIGVLLGFFIASYIYTKRRRQW
ncbi:hypothetical protein [Acinetobacter sp. WZC-1]|uniref:hypothetical protein n=1 Tax=Acinetobacter sp. WZC-1 TaxID=3459034 RepID=UPI00403E2A6A